MHLLTNFLCVSRSSWVFEVFSRLFMTLERMKNFNFFICRNPCSISVSSSTSLEVQMKSILYALSFFYTYCRSCERFPSNSSYTNASRTADPSCLSDSSKFEMSSRSDEHFYKIAKYTSTLKSMRDLPASSLRSFWMALSAIWGTGVPQGPQTQHQRWAWWTQSHRSEESTSLRCHFLPVATWFFFFWLAGVYLCAGEWRCRVGDCARCSGAIVYTTP